jgi:RNA polymerase sigma factor (sigma-70 family)
MDTKQRVELAHEIVGKYDSVIRAFIRCYVYDEHDGDDIYQNVFLSLVRTPPTNLTFLVAYLRRVVRNHATDMTRRTASYTRAVAKYAEQLADEPISLDPETRLMETEQLRRTTEFLEANLPCHMANVLMERCGRGNNTRETAQNLGVKARTVSRYYCVALRHMREIVQDRGIQPSSVRCSRVGEF